MEKIVSMLHKDIPQFHKIIFEKSVNGAAVSIKFPTCYGVSRKDITYTIDINRKKEGLC